MDAAGRRTERGWWMLYAVSDNGLSWLGEGTVVGSLESMVMIGDDSGCIVS